MTPRNAHLSPPPGHFHVSADKARAQVSRTERQSAPASARDSHFVPSHHGRCFWSGTWHGAAASRPAGRRNPELPPSRGRPSRCHGVFGWRGTGAITTDVAGEWLRSASRSPAQRSGVACCAAVVSLLMNARRHPCEAQPGPKCVARRRRLREHRIGHGLSGTTGAGNAIVTERGHMTRPQPDTSGRPAD